MHEEWHACNYLLTVDMEMEPVPGFKAASWDKGYGDFVIRPDLGTLRRIPWLPGTALVLGDVCDHDGEELPHSPRAMLKRQLARLKAARASPPRWPPSSSSTSSTTAMPQRREKHYRDLKTAGWYIEDYHVLETTKREPLMRAIRNGMDAAGIPVQESKGEWGPGQEELNLVYAEALEMADRHVIYKNGVKEIAYLQGKAVSFMAKWRADLAGNSCHIHGSLWDAERPAGFQRRARARPSCSASSWPGCSQCGGDMTYFLAPYVNSYKRFQAGSFAPTNLVWSRDNRTSGFRVLGHGPATRVECRVGGADVNPYLAFAAFLAAGLHGIEQGWSCEPAFQGDAYKSGEVPSVPAHAARRRRPARPLDGAARRYRRRGDRALLHAGRWEQAVYDKAVTDWELMRYFERG